jgi:hypothetical protein
MANLFRNILTIYSVLEQADHFVGRFLRGAMDAFMSIPPAAPFPRCTETSDACPDGTDAHMVST